MKVKDIMTTDLKTCTSDTTVAEAAHLLWDGDCGILPVVGFGGTVTGILSMNDILRAAAAGKKGVANADIIETLQAICAHHHPDPHVVAA